MKRHGFEVLGHRDKKKTGIDECIYAELSGLVARRPAVESERLRIHGGGESIVGGAGERRALAISLFFPST